MNQSYQYEFGNFLFTHFDCDLSYIAMMAFHTFWLWPWEELSEGAHQMNLDRTLSLTFPSNIIARQAARIVMVPATLVQRIGSSKTTTWRWWALYHGEQWALFHPHLKYVGEDNLETENDMYLGGFVHNSNQVEPAYNRFDQLNLAEFCWIGMIEFSWA